MTIHRIRLSTMQKIINVIAVSSGVVSLAVVGSGIYVYVNRASIVDGVKSQVMESVLGGFGGSGGASVPSIGGGVDALPTGANDLSPSAPQANTGQSAGLGVGGAAPF